MSMYNGTPQHFWRENIVSKLLRELFDKIREIRDTLYIFC